jgi:hypothetical protein
MFFVKIRNHEKTDSEYSTPVNAWLSLLTGFVLIAGSCKKEPS